MELDHLRVELKGHLVRNLIEALDKLEEIINSTSPQYNLFIQFKARLKQVTEDDMKGIISMEERNLSLNKLRFAVIQYIDQLELEDLVSEKMENYRMQYLVKISSVEEEQIQLYTKYHQYLNRLPEDQRLGNQIKITRWRLKEVNISARWLKEALQKLGHYRANQFHDEVDRDLIDAVARFQATENLIPVDGIYGQITHAYLLKMRK